MTAATRKVWFITGAGRGMGADFARAVLVAEHALVATGRDTERLSKVLGPSKDLLTVKLDVTSGADAEAAVRAAVQRFGRVDVLVNNAASFYAGYFEELAPDQIDRQLATTLVGPMNVTRAVLPVMRKQRSGHIITISSSAGLGAGVDHVTAYAAAKFGLEGWMESLRAEVAPFGINTTIVNPGFFRTELLTEQSTNFAELSVEDYDERRGRSSSSGSLRMASNPATRRSSRRPSSRSRVRSHRPDALSPVPMRLVRGAKGRRPAGRHQLRPGALDVPRF